MRWLEDGWAVTDEGLISRDHGTISSADFPKTQAMGHSKPFEPPAPDGVSEGFWRFAVDRAHAAHGLSPVSAAALFYGSSQDPPPFTTESSPRKQPDWPY